MTHGFGQSKFSFYDNGNPPENLKPFKSLLCWTILLGEMPDSQTASVLTTLLINAIWGLFLLLLFEKFRHQRNVFAPKMYWEQDHKALAPNPGLFAWVVQLWHIYDDDMIELAGMDAYVLLRYLRMCFVVGVTCSVPALVVVLPVYYSSTPAMEVGINMLSMGNIDVGGSALWASLVFTYLFTIVFLIVIHYEYENFADKRVKYFKSGDRSLPLQMSYTVQVENVPPDFRTNAKLVQLFEEYFPGEVHSGSVVLTVPELEDALAARDTARAKLESAIAGLEASKDHEAPKVTLVDGETSCFGCCLSCSPRCCCCCISSSKVTKENAIDFWKAQLKKNCAMVSSFQSVVSFLADGDAAAVKAVQQKDKALAELDLTNRISKSAFITFKTRKAQAVACQMPIVIGKFPYMTLQQAPAPNDIIWENMTNDIYKIQKVRTATASVLTAGFLFWGVVLAFVSAVSSLANLDKYLPFLKQLNTFTRAILAGQLPVIALIIFVGQLPAILTFIVKNIEKRKTRSEVQDHVFRWFFKYQVANVFLILITGSLFNALAKISSNPALIFTILGTALPQVSVFFMNYMITQLLSGVPAILFRYVDYIIYLLYRYLFNEKSHTRRALLEGPLSKISVDYGQELPNFLYYIFITFIYWIISPIILFISTATFGCLYIAWKYQFVFVVMPTTQGGGRYWYSLYDYSMVGLLASSITMIGYMGIKQGASQAPLLLPLPILIVVAWRYTENEFKTMSLYLPYSDALAAEYAPVETSRLSLTRKSPSTASIRKGYSPLPQAESSDAKPALAPSNSVSSLAGTAPTSASPPPASAAAPVAPRSSMSRLFSSASATPPPTSESPPTAVAPLPPLSQPSAAGRPSDMSLASQSSPPAAATPTGSVTICFKPNFSHSDGFTSGVYKQPALATPNPVQPYPYRVHGIPILNETGELNKIYYAEDPEAAWEQQQLTTVPDLEAGIELVEETTFTMSDIYPQSPSNSAAPEVADTSVVVTEPLPRPKATRRRSSIHEIKKKAEEGSFSDKDEDDGPDDEDEEKSFFSKKAPKKPQVMLVELSAFRRLATPPPSQPVVASAPVANPPVVAADVASKRRASVQQRRRSSLAEIQKLAAEESFSDKEEDDSSKKQKKRERKRRGSDAGSVASRASGGSNDSGSSNNVIAPVSHSAAVLAALEAEPEPESGPNSASTPHTSEPAALATDPVTTAAGIAPPSSDVAPSLSSSSPTAAVADTNANPSLEALAAASFDDDEAEDETGEEGGGDEEEDDGEETDRRSKASTTDSEGEETGRQSTVFRRASLILFGK